MLIGHIEMPEDTSEKHREKQVDVSEIPVENERLQRQIRFLLEVDRLKSVIRRSPLIDGSRSENSAEHSWHVALAAMILAESAEDAGIDPAHTVKLLLVHDLIEIDAGDTYCYDEEGRQDQRQREVEAAERIFSLLPRDQTRTIRKLWEEFEERHSAEARFAHALDRLLPLLHNFISMGRSWQENGIRRSQVEKRMASIRPGSKPLHDFASALIEEAVRRGFLAE